MSTAQPLISESFVGIDVPTSQAPISHVTVFKSNRAEIIRVFRFIPKVTGNYSIKFVGLPEAIISDSIKVWRVDSNSNLGVTYSEESESIPVKRGILKQKSEGIVSIKSSINSSEISRVESSSIRSTLLIRQATVKLHVSELDPFDLRIQYVVYNTSWSSSFDMRVSTANNSIQCICYGRVQQSTGEDWNNAALTLSTAELLNSPYIPSISSRIIVRKEDKINKGFLFRRSSRDIRAPSYNVSNNRKSISSIDPDSTSTITYCVDLTTPVLSNDRPTKILIRSLQFFTTFQHFAMPSTEAAVYFKAKAKNTSEHFLLASDDISIFLDKRFLFKIKMCSVAPGEHFDLFLGVDKAIKIIYAPPNKISKKRGVLSKFHCDTHYACTSVANSKTDPVIIAIIDVLPQSDDDLIKVTLKNPRIDTVKTLKSDDNEESLVSKAMELMEGIELPTSHIFSFFNVAQNETGKMVWVVHVAPMSGVQIPFEYTVEWPNSWEIDNP